MSRHPTPALISPNEDVRALAEIGTACLEQVIATTSTDYVGPKDTVTNEELQVYKNVLKDNGLQTEIYPTLEEAISRGLSAAGTDDVVLLAGCQGMDYGATVCLKQIHQLRPDLPAEKVFAALQNRVAGI